MNENTKPRTCLYLDDVRTPIENLPNAEPWVVVRNYDEFVDYIEANGIPDVVSFDHDLAKEHMNDYYDQMLKEGYQTPDYASYKEKTGLDCARYLITYSIKTNTPIKSCVVHSHKPVRSMNIKNEINSFKKHMGEPAYCYYHRFPFTINT